MAAAAVLALFVAVPSAARARWVERRMVPVAFASCATTETAGSPKALWDGHKTIDGKWTCFHAGLRTPQTHWVAVDLGRPYPITRIVLYHEGFAAANSAHLNTEDFSLFYGQESLDGPWDPIATIENNTASFTQVPAGNTVARFVRLEVTDPMAGSVPDSPNDDWALRLLEMEIFAAEFAPDTVPAGSAAESTATAAMPRLYFFYQGDHARSRAFYDGVIRKAANHELLSHFTVVPVDIASDPARAVRMSVFKSPTLVLESAAGKELGRLQGTPSETEFARFLRQNAPQD